MEQFLLYLYDQMPQSLSSIIIIMQHQKPKPQHQNTLLTVNLQPESASQQVQSSESESQPQNPQLDPEQVQKTLVTLKKLKKIAKKKKLTQLKMTDSKINNVFKKMSYFFIYKSQENKKKKQEAKRLKQSRKHALKAVGIRNKQLLQDENSNISCSPQIIQDFSAELKSSNVQINALKCYICKQRYTQIHHFYDCLCIPCGDFNYLKRTQTADLTGYIALVTGARIKIGYEIALKLLRDGATVIATSRFWKDALMRYQQEKDYQKWEKRLYLMECDFTAANQVEKLISLVKEKFPKLDILINNAAQTIVRPKQFYLQQIINSTKQLPVLPPHLHQFHPQVSPKLIHRYPSLYLPQNPSNLLSLQNSQSSPQQQIQNLISQSFKTNQQIDHSIRDEFNQPLDKRQTNSWVQQLDQVSLIDCYSTQLINSIVPFYLISQFKPLMKKLPTQTPSFIINVSSMQGVFYRSNKNSTHPHTNMAKAALNMITRTSAKQFALDHIYMNSVDTGWVTQQNPYSFKTQRLIPLDCIDGAMRVLDPVYLGVRESILEFGKFVKDYRESKW